MSEPTFSTNPSLLFKYNMRNLCIIGTILLTLVSISYLAPSSTYGQNGNVIGRNGINSAPISLPNVGIVTEGPPHWYYTSDTDSIELNAPNSNQPVKIFIGAVGAPSLAKGTQGELLDYIRTHMGGGFENDPNFKINDAQKTPSNIFSQYYTGQSSTLGQNGIPMSADYVYIYQDGYLYYFVLTSPSYLINGYRNTFHDIMGKTKIGYASNPQEQYQKETEANEKAHEIMLNNFEIGQKYIESSQESAQRNHETFERNYDAQQKMLDQQRDNYERNQDRINQERINQDRD
jgi:hypothetical protein